MDTSKNTILVPFDFTSKAEYAVLHAVKLSRKLKTDIALLHIVKKEAQINEFKSKLEDEAQKQKQKHAVHFEAIVREGTIFKTVNEIVDELDCMLVVMGTHGMSGMQKITGSWALKVIVGSKIPYLVVQQPPVEEDLELKIVFPVDYKAENKEKLKWVEFINHMVNSKIHIFASANKDGVVESRTKANLVFCKKFMDEKNINYELALSGGTTSFSQETVKYSEKIKADIIIVMTTRDIAFHDYMLGAYEQYIIANTAGISVFVINPRTDLMKYGYGGFG